MPPAEEHALPERGADAADGHGVGAGSEVRGEDRGAASQGKIFLQPGRWVAFYLSESTEVSPIRKDVSNVPKFGTFET